MTCHRCGGAVEADAAGIRSCVDCRHIETPRPVHVMVPMRTDDVRWWAELPPLPAHPYFTRHILACRAAVERYGLSS